MLLVLFLALVATLISLLFGRYLGKTLSKYGTTILIIITALINLYYFKIIVLKSAERAITMGT